jgi:hypothetical protein
MLNIIVVTIKIRDMSPCQRGPMPTYLTFEILVELFVKGSWGLKNIIEDAKDLNERPQGYLWWKPKLELMKVGMG